MEGVFTGPGPGTHSTKAGQENNAQYSFLQVLPASWDAGCRREMHVPGYLGKLLSDVSIFSINFRLLYVNFLFKIQSWKTKILKI